MFVCAINAPKLYYTLVNPVQFPPGIKLNALSLGSYQNTTDQTKRNLFMIFELDFVLMSYMVIF